MIIGAKDPKLQHFLAWMKTLDDARPSEWYPDPTDPKFLAWSVVEDDDGVVAASAVQSYGPSARIITRFCIDPVFRTQGMQQPTINGKTFAFHMVEEQLLWCRMNGINNAFFSTENDRVGVIKRHVRIAKTLGLKCQLLPRRYNTCAPGECWQNICLYPLSEKPFAGLECEQ